MNYGLIDHRLERIEGSERTGPGIADLRYRGHSDNF